MNRQDLKNGEVAGPRTDSTPLKDLIETRVSRRTALRGGLGLASSTLFAGAGVSALSGCGSSADGAGVPTELKFTSVPGSFQDNVDIVPEGYGRQYLAPWGTPIAANGPAYRGDGTNTAADQALQIGQNHDGIHYFPVDGSRRGLLVMNHEYTNPTLYAGSGRQVDPDGRPTDPDEVRKDINAHGVSVIEVFDDGSGAWQIDTNSPMNRRITAASVMEITGPARGHALLSTPFSAGTRTRGTVNNCGKGHTAWNTYLACEENIQGYFITQDNNPPRQTDRMGINANGFGYFWNAVAGDPSEISGEFARFDVTSGTPWENEANTFGWIVEIDPLNPTSTPKKRTAMGRFRHEGCEPSRFINGQRLAFYMGDDARFEYLYKFVTDDAYNAANPDRDMLDKGQLYVAKFNADGSGEWLLLDISNPVLSGEFADQGELLVNTRLAADLVGATPMDRPEWTAVDPITGEVYVTMTNNSRRTEASDDAGENAANPRTPNSHGHIIRFREAGDSADATTFDWNIFVFGARASDTANNRSGLTADNEFGSPDGLWFDPRGVLWIQTDNGAPLDYGVNPADPDGRNDPSDQMLAVIPARLGAPEINGDNQEQLKRFFVGPSGCEVTGVQMTPDFRTMFVNVQHPGGSWPDGNGARPRSSIVVIRRDDGGEII